MSTTKYTIILLLITINSTCHSESALQKRELDASILTPVDQDTISSNFNHNHDDHYHLSSDRHQHNHKHHHVSRSMTVWIEEPRVQRVPTGSSVTFKCTGVTTLSSAATIPPVHQNYLNGNSTTYFLVWTKEGGQLPVGSSEASGVLMLPVVSTEDAGNYICTGSDLSSVAQTAATLIVEAPFSHSSSSSPSHTVIQMEKSAPRVRITPRTQTGRLGEKITFECTAEGNPTPEIRWHKRGSTLLNPAYIQGSFLVIPALRKSDESEYYCTATSSVGTETLRTVLFVEPSSLPDISSPPNNMITPDGERSDTSSKSTGSSNWMGEKPVVSVDPSALSVKRGETTRVECRITSGFPVPNISWSFNGSPRLPEGSLVQDHFLIISGITESHEGIYTCQAYNLYGSASSDVRIILDQMKSIPTARIEPESQIIIQGRTGELRCITSGLPSPVITWTKVGSVTLGSRTKIINDNILRIENAETEDRGLYLCRVENREGSAQGSAIVEIERREVPAIELYPSTSQVIAKGSSALFQCRLTAGIPSPSVDWTRSDGRALTPNTEVLEGGVIRFNGMTGDEDGTYICTAENIAGRVSLKALLRTDGSPAVKIMASSPYRVRPGERVKFDCKSDDPQAIITWSKMGDYSGSSTLYPKTDDYQQESILDLSAVTVSDSGIYICSATSGYGRSEERIHLIVEDLRENIPGVVVEDRVVSVPVASRAEIRCFIRGTDKRINLEWRKEGSSLPSFSRVDNGVLFIENVMPQDAGIYICSGIVEGDIILFQDRVRLAIVGESRKGVFSFSRPNILCHIIKTPS